MKIRFLLNPPGLPEYQAGEVHDLKGALAEDYARSYIERGWAEEVDLVAERAAKKAADDVAAEVAAKAKIAADATAKAAADLKAKAEADAKAKIDAAAKANKS